MAINFPNSPAINEVHQVSDGPSWVWNGTTWDLIQQTSDNGADILVYTPAGTGAVATTVKAKLDQTVSVKDFGATGDGATDDAAAIQAAIDSGAGTIYLPDGNYITSATLTMGTVGQSLVGASRNLTSLLANFLGGAVVQVTAGRCSVENLAVSTLASSQRRTNSPLGVSAPNTSVKGTSSDMGIKIIQTGATMTHVKLKDCEVVYQPSNGIYFAGEGSHFLIESTSVTSCGGHGIIVDDGTHNGAAINRPGLGRIVDCTIQDCWGHGIAFGVDGGFTVYRYVIDNCDVFNVARGDNGTNQPALLNSQGAAIAGRMENCKIQNSAGAVSSAVATTAAISLSLSTLVHIDNFRVVLPTTYGIFVQTSCDRITGSSLHFATEPTNQGIRVQSGSTGCRFEGIALSEFTLETDIIDADAEVSVEVDGRRAKTINGSTKLFWQDGIENFTVVSAGTGEITGSVMDIVGQGDLTDTLSTFRFASGVQLPAGYRFLVLNLNAYNLNIAETGNIYTGGTTAVLQPNESLEFVSDGTSYYSIGRAIP